MQELQCKERVFGAEKAVAGSPILQLRAKTPSLGIQNCNQFATDSFRSQRSELANPGFTRFRTTMVAGPPIL